MGDIRRPLRQSPEINSQTASKHVAACASQYRLVNANGPFSGFARGGTVQLCECQSPSKIPQKRRHWEGFADMPPRPMNLRMQMQFKENSCLSFKPLGMQPDSRKESWKTGIQASRHKKDD